MSTAFADLETEIGAMPDDLIKQEIARRGYRLELWTTNDWTTYYLPECSAMVIDDSIDTDDHWAGLVAYAMFERTERAALESVYEDVRIAGWTITFHEPEVQA